MQLSELKLYVNKYGVKALKNSGSKPSTAALKKQIRTLEQSLQTVQKTVPRPLHSVVGTTAAILSG